MRLRNNPLLDTPKKRRIAILATTTFILLSVILTLITNKSGDKNGGGEYFDPGSGQTVSDPEGKTPESYGSSNNQAIFLGFNRLLDVGVTRAQIDSVKLALQSYSTVNKKGIKEFSITVDSISQSIPGVESTEIDTIVTFSMVIDRDKSYNMKLTYSDLVNVHTQMFDDNDQLQFDSNDLLTETENTENNE